MTLGIGIICDRTQCGHQAISKIKAPFSLMAVDAFITISALVLAILTVTKVLPLPPVSAYGLFAGAGGIVIYDILSLVIANACEKQSKRKKEQDGPDLLATN